MSGFYYWAIYSFLNDKDSYVVLSAESFNANTSVSYDQVIDTTTLDSDAYLRVWNADTDTYLDSANDGWVTASELSNYSFTTGEDGTSQNIWVDTYLYKSGRSGWEDTKVDAKTTVDLTADASSYDEGSTASFTLDSNLADGTSVAYTLSSVDTNDIAADSLTGSVSVDADGNATITVDLIEDGSTEGDETLTVSLDDYTADASTTVNDTSKAGETFTLTDVAAVLTDSYSQDVTPEDTYLADANDTVRAFGNLTSTAIIEDPSTTDSDTLSANMGDDQIDPTISNIETLNVNSVNAAADLGFSGITGTNLVTVTGTQNLILSDFVQDGSIETRMSSDETLTITGAANSSATDIFNVSAEGTNGGQIDFASDGNNIILNEVNLESRGSAENDITLATGANYNNVETLNLTGAADLDVTTPWDANLSVDAGNLDGSLTLGLDSVNDSTLADQIVGDVNTLALVNSAANANPDATGIGALDSIALDQNDNNTLTFDENVDVTLLSTNNATGNIDLVIDGADGDNTVSQNLTLGDAEAAGDGTLANAANVAIDFVDTLSLESVGAAADDDTNTLGDITFTGTNNSLETLNVDAASNVSTDTIDAVFDGAADATSVFTLSLSGEGDIELGEGTAANNGVDLNANVDGFSITSNAGGARDVTLSTLGGINAANADGLTVDGDGDLRVLANAANLSGLTVDADSSTGEVSLAIRDAQTSTVNADNFAGIDIFEYANGSAGDNTLSNLANGIDLKFSDEQGNNYTTNNFTFDSANVDSLNVILDGTDNVVKLADTNAVNFDDQSTLTFESIGGNGTNGLADGSTVSANALETLNLETAADSALDVGSLQTRTGDSAIDIEQTAINVTGEEAVSIDALEYNTNLEKIVVTNDSSSALTLDAVNGGHTEVQRLTVDGSGDFTITSLALNGEGANSTDAQVFNAEGTGSVTITTLDMTQAAGNGDNQDTLFRTDGTNDIDITTLDIENGLSNATDIELNGDGDVTIASIGATSSIGTSTLTINSASSDGSGQNEITDPSNLGFGNGGTLELTGDQDLIIGSTANRLTVGDGTDSNTVNVEASNFDGGLDLYMIRENTGATDDDHAINLGTGEINIDINAAGVNANDDSFIFKFSGDGIDTVEITNFSDSARANAAKEADALDFSNYLAGGNSSSYDNTTGQLTDDNDSDAVIVDFDVQDYDGDGNDDLVGTGDGFEGPIVLHGISDLTALDANNFVNA